MKIDPHIDAHTTNRCGIVFFFRYPLYAAGSYFQEFLNALVANVGQITLIAARFPKTPFVSPAGLRFRWVPAPRLRLLEDLVFMLAALAVCVGRRECRNARWVNTIGPRGLLAGWYLRRVHGVPLVCTLEMLNEAPSLINRLHHCAVRCLFRHAPVDIFICWSRYYWERHLEPWGIPLERVRFILPGVDLRRYHPKIDGSTVRARYAKPDEKLIVFAKPLYHPNTEAAKLLVRTVAILRKSLPVRLLIGGGEGQPETAALARLEGVAEHVSFMPPTPFGEIPNHLAAADLIILPFTYAPTVSRSLLEALAMQRPVITTGVGEIQRLFRDGVELVLTDAEPAALAVAAERLLRHDALRNRLALAGRKRVEADFDVMRSAAETANLLESLATHAVATKTHL